LLEKAQMLKEKYFHKNAVKNIILYYYIKYKIINTMYNTFKKASRKSKKNTRKFSKLKCSPYQSKYVDGDLKQYTCYSRNNLQLFKNVWNANNSNDKILTNNSKEIWSFFKQRLNKQCYDELCWLKKTTLSKVNNSELLVKEIFKPFSPESWSSKPNTWLSSVDITKIMKQYEKSHKFFKFIGPSPIDFDSKEMFSTCVWEQLCNFNLETHIKNNISKIGVIFNTDPHNKSGKHWISLFIDLTKKFIFYFDSNGTRMPKQVKVLIKRIVNQAHSLNIQLTVDDNEGFTHQYSDGQCGMYSLYFIIELLQENKTYNYFKTTRIKDSTMKKYRKKYYNEANMKVSSVFD
jgi:hypothetical protein